MQPQALNQKTIVFACLCALLAALVQFPSPFDGNGDSAWLLTVGEKLLGGARPYVDVLEVNPPMSIWLYLPAVWLAQTLGGAAELWLYAYVTGLAGLSLWACWHLSAHVDMPSPSARLGLIAITAFALLILPSRCFAQREHFAAIGLLPFLFALAARWTNGHRLPMGLASIIGLAAGLSVCIKPHLIFVLALAQLSMVVPRLFEPSTSFNQRLAYLRQDLSIGRFVSVEAVVAAFTAIGYLIMVLSLYPQFLSEIYWRVALVYVPHREPIAIFLGLPATALFIFFLAFLAIGRLKPTTRLGVVLLAGAFGGFIAYCLQTKGWGYHQVPTYVFALIGFAAIWLSSDLLQSQTLAKLAGACMLVLFGAGVPALFAMHDKPRALEAVLRNYGDRPSLLIGSSNLGMNFPLARRVNAQWVGRSASQWMSEGAMALHQKSKDPAQKDRLLQLYNLDRTLFVEDALAGKPDILGLAFPGADPQRDLLVWAKEDPRLNTLLRQYQQIGIYDDVRVFVRHDVLALNQKSNL